LAHVVREHPFTLTIPDTLGVECDIFESARICLFTSHQRRHRTYAASSGTLTVEKGRYTYGIIAGGTTRRRACDVDLGTHGANTTVQASHVLAESPRIPDRIRVQLDSH